MGNFCLQQSGAPGESEHQRWHWCTRMEIGPVLSWCLDFNFINAAARHPELRQGVVFFCHLSVRDYGSSISASGYVAGFGKRNPILLDAAIRSTAESEGLVCGRNASVLLAGDLCGKHNHVFIVQQIHAECV